MGTKELQSAIKMELKSIGWSCRKFSNAYFIETNDVDNEDEMEAFYQKVKKQLNRSSFKNTQLLSAYLDFIVQHPDYSRIKVKPVYIEPDLLSDSLKEQLKAISTSIDGHLEQTDL